VRCFAPLETPGIIEFFNNSLKEDGKFVFSRLRKKVSRPEKRTRMKKKHIPFNTIKKNI